MAQYEAVIGLEVHAQLTTNTKLFCACATRFGDEPNTNVCPVCAGMPGVLPVMNERALEYACKMAMAIEATVNLKSIFARKNYFYPDLPKAYQISQYEQPLCERGRVEIEAGGERKVIGVTRIHMEEDAGKNIHSAVENRSFVDLNRCGVPLIEIVSEPDLRSSEEAVAYLKELRAILVYLGICDGNMEEGSFRCDANVSVRHKGETAFGVRTEIKNVNSFRNVQRAIEYEIGRHIDCIEDGEAIVQETRLFDANKGVTQSMRGKEEAHDYRYFPDPDLLPVLVDEVVLDRWRSELPELPKAKRERFMAQYGLGASDAALLTAERDLADYFEAAAATYPEPKKIANWMLSELLRELKDCDQSLKGCKLTPRHLAKLVKLVESGAISGKIGKQIFGDLVVGGVDPEKYVAEKGLVQISDSGELDAVVDAVIAENPKEAERFRGGETKLTGFFVGQIMKKTKGQANPKLVNELLAAKLGKS